MADFGETINAYLEGRQVNMRPLVKFDFADGAVRLWSGEYPLTIGGETYLNLGNLVSIEGLDQAAALESAMMTFTISGIVKAGDASDIIAIAAAANKDNYLGRAAIVYLQFFGVTPDDEWEPLDEPFAIKAGYMMRMPISKVPAYEGWMITVSLQANNLFYVRGIPPASYYTDRDQQLVHPGDKALQFILQLQRKQLSVPWR